MADWFKTYSDELDSKGMQFAIGEQPAVVGVWQVLKSEATKNRSSSFKWEDADYELIGYSRKLNIGVAIVNQCISLLERIKYIARNNGTITILGWDKMQSDYAKGKDKGWYRHKSLIKEATLASDSLATSKQLASDSLVTSVRREEKRREENISISSPKPQPSAAECESVYALYPKKVGKGAALKAIKKAIADIGVEKLTEAVTEYAQARAGADHQYTPNPATWFNRRSYLDDRATWVQCKPEVKPWDKPATTADQLLKKML